MVRRAGLGSASLGRFSPCWPRLEARKIRSGSTRMWRVRTLPAAAWPAILRKETLLPSRSQARDGNRNELSPKLVPRQGSLAPMPRVTTLPATTGGEPAQAHFQHEARRPRRRQDDVGRNRRTAWHRPGIQRHQGNLLFRVWAMQKQRPHRPPKTHTDLSPESWELLRVTPTGQLHRRFLERVDHEEPTNLSTMPWSFGQVAESLSAL